MKPILTLILILLTVSLMGCGSAKMIIDDNISKEELMLSHNRERALQGLSQMQIDPDLTERAQAWAESMVRKNSLRHSSLSGTDFRYVGENIAMGQSSVDEVMEAWMNSTGHRHNILGKNYTHAGFGYARFSNGRPYWCAQFGGH